MQRGRHPKPLDGKEEEFSISDYSLRFRFDGRFMMRLLMLCVCLVSLASPVSAAPRHVIVIAMENKDVARTDINAHDYIYGNTEDAPYLNGTLAKQAARAAKFIDELPKEKSQPHYILMEAGRTVFDDTRFTCNNDPGESCDFFSGRPNWTKSREHLTAQIETTRHPALTWMTYQQAIDPEATGACPVQSAGLYAAKHNPFVYFADVAGAPPAADDANCIAHTRDLSRFQEDMTSGALANYVFITPDLCNGMHGAPGCEQGKVVNGDRFLESFLPPVLSWAQHNKAVIFIVWDEGKTTKTLPFFAAGWGIKTDYVSHVDYSHRSLIKTVERIFGLPVLESVKDANDFSDLFKPGFLP